MQNAEVLVASHDKAFLEALQVTDKINVVRGSVGEPGHLRVTLAALACKKMHKCDDKLCLRSLRIFQVFQEEVLTWSQTVLVRLVVSSGL
jgi:hypothetical protein